MESKKPQNLHLGTLGSGKSVVLRDYFPQYYLRCKERSKYGVPKPHTEGLGHCVQFMCV